MRLFGPPNVEKLKAKGDIKGLIKALHYKKDWIVRKKAANALGDLGCKEAIGPLVECLISDEESLVRKAATAALDNLGWVPTDQGKAAAWFWRYKGNIDKCAACGVYAIEPLLPLVINGNYEAMEAFATLGQPALEVLIACANAIFQQYQSFTSGIHELNFVLDTDRRVAATIKEIAKRLEYCTETIGKFGTPLAEAYLVQLYKLVKSSIYSHPEGGFPDMFDAVDVREAIVSALRYTDGSAGGLQLLVDVLENDPAMFVRWEAANVIEKLADKCIDRVKDKRIENALRKFVTDMQQQDDISRRSRLSRYVSLLERIKSQ